MTDPQNLSWWQRGVVYQIYPRSFQDSTGNGIGDLQGIIDRLDYLNDGTDQSLGIDAIWLSPIYPSPMADFGYDVADYCDIHPDFGDLAAFDRLVAEAGRRGIKIIMDWVPNHTSDRHPWFVESRRSRTSPKRDWYIWRDPKPDGSLPNNWGAAFGGPAWTLDEGTGQYYLHQFLKEQPELNWRNPEVQAAMHDVLRFWFRRGVAGFRIDVVGFLIKDADLRDNPPNPDADPNLPPEDIYGRQHRIYTEHQPEVHDLIREFRCLADEYGPGPGGRDGETCLIGEVWSNDFRQWVKYYGVNGTGLHLPFNFGLMGRRWRARDLRTFVDRIDGRLPAWAWPNQVLGSHDAPRIASRVGPAQARNAAMLLLTLRGTPFLYYGDELGIENGVIPREKGQDPQGLVLGMDRSRDVCRTPMQWNAGPNAGFAVPTAEPWLLVSADYQTRNVVAQSADPSSMLNLCRRLIWYRRATPALYGGSYRSLDASDERCLVYLRQAGEQRRLVALNLTGEEATIALPVERQGPGPGGREGQVAISTYLDREGKESLARLTLRPNEGLIVEL
jgi:alpha-glucosidase